MDEQRLTDQLVQKFPNELKQKIEEIQKSSRALRAKYEQAYAEHMAKRPNGSNRASWSSDFYEQGKKNFPDYFDAQQNIDALKNEIAKIEKKQVSQQRKNAISPLDEALEKNGDLINNAHKFKNISFKSLPVDVFNGAGQSNKDNPAFLLHKSPNYNKRQSSEYKLMMIDGKPAYARKSNHWGTFGTNIKDVDEAVKHLGISREEAESRQMDDPFGRIGTKYHNWSLTGGDEGRNTSQAGYVHLDDLDPIAKANGGDVDGITAYHGSPHDFDEFDTSKIGTGEGAQAYGHGLYFAGHEPVAKDYRDRLTDKTSSFRVGNIDMPKWILRGIESSPDRNAAIEKHRQDFLKRLDEDTKDQKTSAQPWMSAARISSHKDILAGLDQLQHGSNVPHTKGRMYEVAINAHPNHFLDWDKPLSEQSDHVKNAFNSHKDLIHSNPYLNTFFDNIVADRDGSEIYNELSHKNAVGLGNKGASDFLNSMGIHGIRYLDAGSRVATDQPTHNYVVFDHNRVSVKRKYAQGGDVEAYGDGGSTHEPHQRAEEQGYSIKGYHFTRGPKAQSIAKSKQFDPYLSEGEENATFFWDNPQAANDWAHFAGGVDPNKPQEKMTPNELDRLSRFAPSMLPVRIHPGKHTVVNWPEATGLHSYDNVKMKKLIQAARNEGYDTVRIKNMREGDVEHELENYSETPHDQIAVLNPAMIRSEFAQFDPARQHENDIGARKGGTIDRENVDYKKMPHSPIVEHVLGKISAPLPALDPHLMTAIAGRRS